MYFLINLAFLFFFVFIFSKIFSLFQKIFEFAITETKKASKLSNSNNLEKNKNNTEEIDSRDINLQNMRDVDSNIHDYQSSSTNLDSNDGLKANTELSAEDDFKSNDFSASNNIFSKFSHYTEAEKAILYSEIISGPKAKK